MEKKLTKKTKKAITIYVMVLLILFVIVEILPKVTDVFDTTQVLEPGNLVISYDTEGYLIKDESISIAAQNGKVKYLEEEGVAVKKGHPIVKVEEDKKDSEKSPRFTEYTDRLNGFDGLSKKKGATISGVVSFSIDGYENYFTSKNMEKIDKNEVEGLSLKSVDLKRDSVIKGEPVYKISGDDNWYILCWVDKKTAETYYEGRDVTIKMPDGDVDAEVYKIKKEGNNYRVIFYLDVYYESFATTRKADISIVISDNAGLIIENNCIITKHGKQGVYVRDKNGDYSFTQISVIASNEKESVIRDATFIDEEGYQIYTVDVYDEVSKHPKNLLADDLKKEAEEAKEEEK